MAKLEFSVTTDDLPKSDRNFDPLPDGWYTVTITESDIKATKKGDGSYIKNRYDVVGPTHQGRVVFGNINIKNPNKKAEEIGYQDLGDLLRAIGMPKLDDTDQLVGKSLQIRLVQKTDDFGTRNEVKGFKATTSQVASTPSAPAKSSTPPWVKK